MSSLFHKILSGARRAGIRRTAFAFLVPFGFAIFAPSDADGQINSGVITGAATDPAGGCVPRAKVEIVENGTEIAHAPTTNNSGQFTVPYLEAGI